VHHVVLDQWSRGASPLHRRDPRVKIIVLLVILIVLATAHRELPLLAGVLFAMLCGTMIWARIPLGGAIMRAGLVLPFALVFAAASWIGGDPGRGVALIRGIEMFGAPRFLLMVAQFLYRYLFVISEQAQHMRKSAAARGGSFRGAAGALAVLFARSYQRAGEIHRAMLARGFQGQFHPLAAPHFHLADTIFLLIGCALPLAARVALERIA
jgi:cobalt/nickel transport system permease protein